MVPPIIMAPPSTEGDRSSATGVVDEVEEDVEVLRMARPAFELLEGCSFGGLCCRPRVRKDQRHSALLMNGADSALVHGQQA
jgi:hypothetical protein